MPNAFMPLDFRASCPSLPRPWAPIATRALWPSTRGNIHGVERLLFVGAACRTNMLARSSSGKAVTVLIALRLHSHEGVCELTVAR